MSLMGEDGRPPVRVGVSIVDLATGMWSVIGILAALDERRRTGRGGVVDTSLYETALAWMTIPIAAYLVDRRGSDPAGIGGRHDRAVPGLCRGRRLSDGGGRQRQSVSPAVHRRSAAPSWPKTRAFAPTRTGWSTAPTLIAILDASFAAEPMALWAARLDAAGIPNGPMQSVDQVVADAQTAALGMIQRFSAKLGRRPAGAGRPALVVRRGPTALRQARPGARRG